VVALLQLPYCGTERLFGLERAPGFGFRSAFMQAGFVQLSGVGVSGPASLSARCGLLSGLSWRGFYRVQRSCGARGLRGHYTDIRHRGTSKPEWFDVLDQTDLHTIVGKKLRHEVHRDGDWHRAVHVWLYDPASDAVLLQLRSAAKDTHPLCWDVSAAGHLHSGEHDLSTAAKRELEEELGIGSVEPELLFTVRSEYVDDHLRDREVQSVYVVCIPGAATATANADEADALGTSATSHTFLLQKEEVEQVRWMPLSEYLAAVEQHRAGYVPRPQAYIEKLRASLLPLN